ncbi:spore germination protein [Paenibacillus sp. NFR01]|uniref:spore germination protein n=1 Tax=Paenibacillus sp. NFR01 TaxID=1566279 RepID=UPI0008BF9491|nr:spore germination protein [Paenibacillus sp. NFR01]SET07101.1 spore germination protein KA [Paenibacillus sp. NFR01]
MIADPSAEENKKRLLELLSESSDFKSITFVAGERSWFLFYLNTMVDPAVVQEHIIRPLLGSKEAKVREAISILDYSESDLISAALMALVEGKTVLQNDLEPKFYLLGTELSKERSISIPLNERVLRGSNEALNENLDTNINLIRKIMVTPDLAVKQYELGRKSKNRISMLYLNSFANKEVLAEFDHKLSRLDIDKIEALGFIQDLIQDGKFTWFPRILVTERPDRIKSYLLDGKIAILIDGSPDCMIVPVSFWAFFQSPDDYQVNWIIGSSFRILRIVSFILGICLPGAYVALVSFDPRILPYEVALTMQSTMANIAIPPVLEAIFMLVTLEILREATIRLESFNSQTIGVVGGIVIGTIVVQANLISTMMVVVVAFTAIASFIIPSYEMRSAARLLTYPFIILSSILGLIGLVLAFLLVLAHLARVNTMGIPYFYSGFSGSKINDTIFRGPVKK